MAVHVPLSKEAIAECKISHAKFSKYFATSKWYASRCAKSRYGFQGFIILSLEKPDSKGEHKLFSNFNEIAMAMEFDELDIHSTIRVVHERHVITTTAGRMVLRSILPSFVSPHLWNRVLKKKDISNLIDCVYKESGIGGTAVFLDNLKDLGFKYATKAGISIAAADIIIPDSKTKMITELKSVCVRF